MVLWVFILTLFGAAVAWFGDNLPPELRARVLAVQGMIGSRLPAVHPVHLQPVPARLLPAPANGQGLNPVLQDPGLAFHPPFLYLGYVGFSVGVLLRGRGADRGPGRCRLGALGAALDAWPRGARSPSASRWEAGGPTTRWAGAAGGSGTRSRTPRSCRGSPAPRCSIPRSWWRSATRSRAGPSCSPSSPSRCRWSAPSWCARAC